MLTQLGRDMCLSAIIDSQSKARTDTEYGIN